MAEPDPPQEGCAEPVFWFELGPEGSYGMGFWQAPAVTMAKFRARMDREPKAMESWPAASRSRTYLCWRGGLQAPKAAPSRLLTPWYSKKSFALSHDAPHGEPLWSHDLVDLLLEGTSSCSPTMNTCSPSAVTPIPGHNNRIYIASNPASSAY